MKKALTFKNALIGSAVAVVLLGGIAISKAYADHHGGEDITLEKMMEKAGERFDKMDANADGTVTQEEADAAKSASMNDRLAKSFMHIDSDGDGTIREGDRGYHRLTNRYDLEGDLTLEQIQEAATDKMSAHMEDDDYGHGRRGNGMQGDDPVFPLTREQALADAQSKFNQLDANGDGMLTGDEKPRHGKRHGGDCDDDHGKGRDGDYN